MDRPPCPDVDGGRLLGKKKSLVTRERGRGAADLQRYNSLYKLGGGRGHRYIAKFAALCQGNQPGVSPDGMIAGVIFVVALEIILDGNSRVLHLTVL